MSNAPRAVKEQVEKVRAMMTQGVNTDSPEPVNREEDIGNPTPEAQQQQPTNEEQQKPLEPKPETPETTSGDDLPAELTDEEKTDKARYKALKGKYNKEVIEVRKDNRELRNQIVSLNGQLLKAQESAGNPGEVERLTQENAQLRQQLDKANSPDLDKLREEYSAEVVDSILDAVSSPVPDTPPSNTPQPEVTQSPDPLALANEEAYNRTVRGLIAMLKVQKVDFQAVNNDPLFYDDHLKQLDPRSGKSLHELLNDALNEGDVERAANFFTEFVGSSPGAAEQPDQRPSLEAHVKPNPSDSPPETVGTGRPIVGQYTFSNGAGGINDSEVRRFYEDKRNKRITNEQVAEAERNLFATTAVAQNN